VLYPLIEGLTGHRPEGRLSTGTRVKRVSRSTAGEQRHIALSHAVIGSDVAGLAALLDDAKLHSNDSERAAKFLLGLN
jgi:hypothetical protein